MQPAPSNRPLLKVSIIVALLIVSFWVASFFPDLVLALIIASLVAFILRPLVKLFEFRFGLRRGLSIVMVFVLVGSLTAFVTVKGVPILLGHARTFYDQFKTFPFEEKLSESIQGAAAKFPFVSASDISRKVHEFIQGGIRQFGSILENFLAATITLAIVPFVTYFILAEGDTALKKLIERVPNKYFEMTLNVLYKIERDLVGYLHGWIMDSVIIGIISILGYALIGIQYPIILGSVSGIANLVPYLGPVAGAVPALLVSLTQYGDFRMLFPVIVLTITIQAIDNVIVQPLSFAKTVDMHPLTVVLVLIVGNGLMGVAGMILAIPIATILKVSAAETYWGLKHYRITT